MEKIYKAVRKHEAHAMFSEAFHAIEDLKRCECGKVLDKHDIISNTNDMCAECYSNYCSNWEAWQQQSNEC